MSDSTGTRYDGTQLETKLILNRFSALPIKKLEVDFACRNVMRFWAKPISGMESLEHLRVFGGSVDDFIQIKSKSLITLEVDELKGSWTFYECPKLQSFACASASWNREMEHLRRSGSLPLLSHSQFNDLPSNVESSLEVTAEAMPFLGVRVPPSCRIVFKRFSFPNISRGGLGLRDGYDQYMKCLRQLEQDLASAELEDVLMERRERETSEATPIES